MTTLRFFVAGLPQYWPRPRTQDVGKPCYACKRRPYTNIIQPTTDELQGWQQQIRSEAAKVYTGDPMTSLCAFGLTFIFPRPDKYKTKTKPMPRIVMGDVPDLDNLEKAVFDALKFDKDEPARKGVIVRDDRQFAVRLFGGKFYAEHQTGVWDFGEPIGLDVTIKVLASRSEFHVEDERPDDNPFGVIDPC